MDPTQIKHAMFNHYQSFFRKGDVQQGRITCSNLPKVRDKDVLGLEVEFSEKEIWDVLKSVKVK